MYPVIRRRSARRLCVRTVSLYKGRRLVTVLETFVAFVSLLHDDRDVHGEVQESVSTSTCSLLHRAKTVRYVAIVRWTDLARPPSTISWIESMDLDVNVYTTCVVLTTFRTSVVCSLDVPSSRLAPSTSTLVYSPTSASLPRVRLSSGCRDGDNLRRGGANTDSTARWRPY